MSETTTRAALVAEIVTATNNLPESKSALATANDSLKTSEQELRAAQFAYGTASEEGRSALAEYESNLELQRNAEALVIGKQAIITERTKDLISLPSGRAWQEAEAKGSALVQGRQFMADALGARFADSITALQALRGLITASIPPEQLASQSAANLATITSNLATQGIGEVDLCVGTPSNGPFATCNG